ncbi:hypothetical protein L1887_40752 [Cichorium endivia]|nr:hypothetical protein L1887_40752 [Cichorium endivia]
MVRIMNNKESVDFIPSAHPTVAPPPTQTLAVAGGSPASIPGPAPGPIFSRDSIGSRSDFQFSGFHFLIGAWKHFNRGVR